MVEFVSYDGEYPNLCSGTLVLKVDGRLFTFPKYALSSGGRVWFSADWDEHVEDGPWGIHDWPLGFPEWAKPEALRVLNDNVRWGCCGGCI